MRRPHLFFLFLHKRRRRAVFTCLGSRRSRPSSSLSLNNPLSSSSSLCVARAGAERSRRRRARGCQGAAQRVPPLQPNVRKAFGHSPGTADGTILFAQCRHSQHPPTPPNNPLTPSPLLKIHNLLRPPLVHKINQLNKTGCRRTCRCTAPSRARCPPVWLRAVN
jgi:hypothetical protein